MAELEGIRRVLSDCDKLKEVNADFMNTIGNDGGNGNDGDNNGNQKNDDDKKNDNDNVNTNYTNIIDGSINYGVGDDNNDGDDNNGNNDKNNPKSNDDKKNDNDCANSDGGKENADAEDVHKNNSNKSTESITLTLKMIDLPPQKPEALPVSMPLKIGKVKIDLKEDVVRAEDAKTLSSISTTPSNTDTASATASALTPVSSSSTDLQSIDLNQRVGIFISKITTTKLKNIEMMFGDKNDVYLLLKFGSKWEARTSTKWGGGSDVSWSYKINSTDVNMRWDAVMSDIQSSALTVAAMDENRKNADKIIGEGQQKIVLPISFIKNQAVGESLEMTVDIPLSDKASSKSTGFISFTLKVKHLPFSDSSAPTKPSIEQLMMKDESLSDMKDNKNEKKNPTKEIAPPAFTVGTLSIKKIQCSGLNNVEMLGKNDPYVVFDYGAESYKTETQEGAGAECLFEYLDIKFAVEEDLIKFEEIRIQVCERTALRDDVLIGSSSLSLKNLLKRINEDVDIAFDISDKKSRVVGHVVLYVQLSASPETGLTITMYEYPIFMSLNCICLLYTLLLCCVYHCYFYFLSEFYSIGVSYLMLCS
jgi:hypothetical protein